MNKTINNIIPRIKSIKPKENFQLEVIFDSGEEVLYDVSVDIDQIPDFEPLKTQTGLFRNVRLDESRTCIYWNDMIDLPSDTLLEYGRPLAKEQI